MSESTVVVIVLSERKCGNELKAFLKLAKHTSMATRQIKNDEMKTFMKWISSLIARYTVTGSFDFDNELANEECILPSNKQVSLENLMDDKQSIIHDP